MLGSRRFPLLWPEAHMGEMAYSVRRSVMCLAGNGRMGKYRNGSSLSSPSTQPLTVYAKQIDSIFGINVPTMSHKGNEDEVKEA